MDEENDFHLGYLETQSLNIRSAMFHMHSHLILEVKDE